ncbi:hypothetical protein [Umezawaea beigongshangensis]|uniref:hypothetical protein n=1 Tax=Umezawaea beigongshangensis TaxID=2780383 RepID=UPI0018F21CC3|nr:hypothetical protein [Umezawaea beigongshangensis]
MNGSERRSDAPIGPPWSVDLLADLHAGVLDPETEAELRPRVESDPEALEVLAALDATLADLSALPPLIMPDDVAARIDAALAEEAAKQRAEQAAPAEQAAAIAPVVSIDAARQRRAKRLGWGAGLLAAAAAAVGVVVVALPGGGGDSSPPAAQQPPGASDAPPLAVRSDALGEAYGEVFGLRNFGPLENQTTLAGCLEGAGITGNLDPVGVSPVTLDGDSAVMAILPEGLQRFRFVVLDPNTCGPGKPEGLLADSSTGGESSTAPTS